MGKPEMPQSWVERNPDFMNRADPHIPRTEDSGRVKAQDEAERRRIEIRLLGDKIAALEEQRRSLIDPAEIAIVVAQIRELTQKKVRLETDPMPTNVGE